MKTTKKTTAKKKTATITNKAELERVIKKAGGRCAAMRQLGMKPPAFYRLVHKFGLKIDKAAAARGKLAAGAAK